MHSVDRIDKQNKGPQRFEGEILEYALIAGLIIVAAIAVLGSIGSKILNRSNSLIQPSSSQVEQP